MRRDPGSPAGRRRAGPLLALEATEHERVAGLHAARPRRRERAAELLEHVGRTWSWSPTETPAEVTSASQRRRGANAAARCSAGCVARDPEVDAAPRRSRGRRRRGCSCSRRRCDRRRRAARRARPARRRPRGAATRGRPCTATRPCGRAMPASPGAAGPMPRLRLRGLSRRARTSSPARADVRACRAPRRQHPHAVSAFALGVLLAHDGIGARRQRRAGEDARRLPRLERPGAPRRPPPPRTRRAAPRAGPPRRRSGPRPRTA